MLVELNMQVACNVRAGSGLRSISIALYGFKSALSYKLNNEELRYLQCQKKAIIVMKGRMRGG